MNKVCWTLAALLLSGAAARADVQDLIKKLGSSDNEVRRAAAKELGDLGKEAKPAIKALTLALKDKDRFVRRWSADALGNIGPDAKSSVPALVGMLSETQPAEREAAIRAIGKMGPDGIPALGKALTGTTSDVQEFAITALASGGEAAAAPLAGAIKNTKMNAPLRSKAIASVLKLGKPARVAVPSLTETAKNPRAGGNEGRQLQIDAINALGRLATTQDKAAVTVLDDITKAKKANNQVKGAATRALKTIQARK